MTSTSSMPSEQTKLQGYPTAVTDQEPSETGMLVLIARCLLEANLPSLSKHCLRAAELILEQQRVIAVWKEANKLNEKTIRNCLLVQAANEKAIDRLIEHKWKDLEIAKAEEEDYQRNLPKVKTQSKDWVTKQEFYENMKGTK